MAIVNNLWLRGTKKRLAGTVVYQSMGQTIQRELAASVTNPRTEAQMAQRVRWANIVALYRVLRPMMKYAFESKKRTQSDYNAFMSANITSSPIALTKQEAAAAACVVAPYTITRGSLPSVQIAADGNDFVTNLYQTEGIDFDLATVGQFSKQLLSANPGLRAGDQISFIRLTQSTNGATGYPYVVLRKYEVLLDESSNELVSRYLPAELLDVKETEGKVATMVLNNGGKGAFAIIVSRTIAGKTFVSSQELQPVNMDAIITAYSSAEQFAGAAASYGVSEDVFLSSDAAQRVQVAPVELSSISVVVDGVNYFDGMEFPKAGPLKSKVLAMSFNQPIESSNVQAIVIAGESRRYAENVSVSGDKVRFTLPQATPFPEDAYIDAVLVSIDNVNFTIHFKHYYSPGLDE